jgi:hypothetical protein
VIKLYDHNSNDSPQPLRYKEQKGNPVGEKNAQNNKKYAPFAEIEQKHNSEEEIPIFRIE